GALRHRTADLVALLLLRDHRCRFGVRGRPDGRRRSHGCRRSARGGGHLALQRLRRNGWVNLVLTHRSGGVALSLDRGLPGGFVEVPLLLVYLLRVGIASERQP